MTKNSNHFHQQLKLHCANCQTIYQLLEIHTGNNANCTDNCLTKWQTLLFNHYQEKILFHLSQEQENQAEQATDLAEKLGIKAKEKK